MDGARLTDWPLVGRVGELKRIESCLDRPLNPVCRGLLVLGAAGMGKTSLLLAASDMARERGIRAATASCLPLHTPVTLDPVLELLRQLDQPAELRPGAPLEEQFASIADHLILTAGGEPVLLCVDDLHLADQATLDLIHYLVVRAREMPILWLLSGRPGRLQGALAYRLERTGRLAQIRLGPMSGADTRLLAPALLGRPVAQELVDVIDGRTGRNPFLFVELLQELRSRVAVTADDSDLQALAAELRPPSVTDATEDRMTQLSSPAANALSWAAVLWDEFSQEELSAAMRAPASEALDELADDGLLLPRQGLWTCRHPLIRDAVYELLGPAERSRRHLMLADEVAGARSARRARQLELACRWRCAAHAHLELAASAVHRGDGSDAARLYVHARELAARTDDEDLTRAADGGVLIAQVRAGTAAASGRRVSAHLARLRAAADEERLAFLGELAMTVLESGYQTAADEARRILNEAESLLESASTRGRAALVAAQARLWVSTGGLQDGRNAAAEAVQLARQLDDAGLTAHALNSLGIAAGLCGDVDDGVRLLEQAMQAAAIAARPTEVARAHQGIALLAERSGDVELFERHTRQALELPDIHPALLPPLRSALGRARAETGELNDALADQLAALRDAELAACDSSGIALDVAHTRLMRGELNAAREILERHACSPWGCSDLRCRWLWALLLEAEGLPAQALNCAQEALADHGSPVVVLAGTVRTAAACEDLCAARAVLPELEAAARWRESARAALAEAEAWLAIAEGRTCEAAIAFRTAAELYPGLYASTRMRLEAARLSGGCVEVREALAIFERIGARHAADQARAVALALGTGAARRPAAPNVLSSRELEVVQLIAAGHTNVEIAERLYLSPKTVERHVTNILAKLGLRSRVQVATEAVTGRLPGSAPAPMRAGAEDPV